MLRDIQALEDGLAKSGDTKALIERLDAELQHCITSESDEERLADPDLDVVDRVGADLTDLLRWERRYPEAIAVQNRLASLMPGQAQRCRIAAATLAIEAGETEEGLRHLEIEAALLAPAEGKFLLASTLTWVQQFQLAEPLLQEVLSDVGASSEDRASAAYLLFQVLSLGHRLTEAVEAWEAAVALEPSYSDSLAELVRAQIYWRDFEGAMKTVARDSSEIRRSFYRALIATRTTLGGGRAAWAWVSECDAQSVGDAQEEYAEAALRNVSPQLALDVLVPFVERQELSRYRLILTGLAWAQERQVVRAKWALELALRLAEIERPRRTRQGAGSARIFDAETRIAYGEIPIDADVRVYLDHFFMPIRPHDGL